MWRLCLIQSQIQLLDGIFEMECVFYHVMKMKQFTPLCLLGSQNVFCCEHDVHSVRCIVGGWRAWLGNDAAPRCGKIEAKLRPREFSTFSTEIICTINIVAIIKVIKLGQKNLIVFFKLLEQSGRYGRGLIIAVHCTVGRVGTAMWPLGCWHTGEGSREGLRKAQMVQMVH